MLTVNLNDVKYPLPKSLTIEAWQSIVAWDFEVPSNRARIVAAATGAPYELLRQLDPESLELPTIFIVDLLNQRKACKHKDFNQFSFGEFVDLDVWFSLGVDKHLQDMAGMLAEGPLDAAEATYVVDEYAKWRAYIYRSYRALFGLQDSDFDEIEHEEIPDKMQVARSWYKMIVTLANGNLLDMDRVTEEPLKKVLNFMAHQKELQLEENERQLKKQRQYDLQRNR